MKQSILYLHRTRGQGAEGSHIRGMVNGFRGYGLHVDIVGPPGIDPYRSTVSTQAAAPSLISRLLHGVADHAPQWCFELAELCYNPFSWIRLHRQWKQGRGYGFLYERYSLNSFAGILFAQSRNIPLVLEVNDATVIERSRPLSLQKMARWIEHRVLHRASLIITITNQFKELLIQYHDLDPGKILVLPNAIDPEQYILDPQKRLSRQDWQLPEDAIILGCVGAFVPWHGLEFLVDTMAPVCEQYKIYFFFIGDGPVRQDVEARAEQLGVRDRVRFTCFVDAGQVPYLLDLIDIAVIPESNAHCSPMKLFEYMAAGKPVILPRYQPLLDVVNEEQGVFFEPHAGDQLKTVTCALLANPDKREVLGEKGKELVAARYTWHANSQQVLELLG